MFPLNKTHNLCYNTPVSQPGDGIPIPGYSYQFITAPASEKGRYDMSRYAAYVGSYTDTNDGKGLTVYDMNLEDGSLTKKAEYTVSNASYVASSHGDKYLYAITDPGVVSFAIHPDGSLKRLNSIQIRGMRGCHMVITRDNRFLVTCGYYDGKVTVIRLKENGALGEIAASVFHKSPGNITERNLRPHCRCVSFSPDEKYLFVADSGMDLVKIYRFNHETGAIRDIDIMHSKLLASPCFIRFSRDGRFFYVLKESLNMITVYSYEDTPRGPLMTRLQSISTLAKKFNDYSACVSFIFTKDEKNLVVCNAGENSICIYRRDPETGLLEQLRVLPISGVYPKKAGIFPNDRYLVSVNQESNSLSLFQVDFESGLILMKHRAISVPQPSSIAIVKLPEEAPEEE